MEHGAGELGSAFLLRLPPFLEVSGTRFRAVAGNTYVLAVTVESVPVGVLLGLREFPPPPPPSGLEKTCSRSFLYDFKGQAPFPKR